MLHVDRLRHERIATHRERALSSFVECVRRQGDDLRLRTLRSAQLSHDFESVEPWHHEIEQHEIGRIGLQRGERRVAVVGFADLETEWPQQAREQRAILGHVVCDQDAAHGSAVAGYPGRGHGPAATRVLRARGRECQREGRTVADAARHAEVAVHGFRQTPRDREPQPQALGAARPHLIERLEDSLEIGGCDADARVFHDEREAPFVTDALLRFDAQRHGAAARRELHGVAEQVDQNLPQAPIIGANALRTRPRELRAKSEARGFRARAEHSLDVTYERTQVELHELDLDASRFHTGEIEHLVDQRQQVLAGAMHGLDLLALLRAERRVALQ